MSDINWDLIPQWAHGIALSKGEVYLIGSREKPQKPDDVVVLATRPRKSSIKKVDDAASHYDYTFPTNRFNGEIWYNPIINQYCSCRQNDESYLVCSKAEFDNYVIDNNKSSEYLRISQIASIDIPKEK